MELDNSDLVPSLKNLSENKKFSTSDYNSIILKLIKDIDKKNYKLINSDYNIIKNKYEILHKLLKKFILNYIEKVDNEYKLRQLVIDDENSAVNIKRKKEASEIISYGIFFPLIPTFKTLIIIVDKYEKIFADIINKYTTIIQLYNEFSDAKEVNEDIDDPQYTYKIFLKLIKFFFKYINAMKLGNALIISFADLNKIIDLLTIFIQFNDKTSVEDYYQKNKLYEHIIYFFDNVEVMKVFKKKKKSIIEELIKNIKSKYNALPPPPPPPPPPRSPPPRSPQSPVQIAAAAAAATSATQAATAAAQAATAAANVRTKLTEARTATNGVLLSSIVKIAQKSAAEATHAANEAREAQTRADAAQKAAAQAAAQAAAANILGLTSADIVAVETSVQIAAVHAEQAAKDAAAANALVVAANISAEAANEEAKIISELAPPEHNPLLMGATVIAPPPPPPPTVPPPPQPPTVLVPQPPTVTVPPPTAAAAASVAGPPTAAAASVAGPPTAAAAASVAGPPTAVAASGAGGLPAEPLVSDQVIQANTTIDNILVSVAATLDNAKSDPGIVYSIYNIATQERNKGINATIKIDIDERVVLLTTSKDDVTTIREKIKNLAKYVANQALDAANQAAFIVEEQAINMDVSRTVVNAAVNFKQNIDTIDTTTPEQQLKIILDAEELANELDIAAEDAVIIASTEEYFHNTNVQNHVYYRYKSAKNVASIVKHTCNIIKYLKYTERLITDINVYIAELKEKQVKMTLKLPLSIKKKPLATITLDLDKRLDKLDEKYELSMVETIIDPPQDEIEEEKEIKEVKEIEEEKKIEDAITKEVDAKKNKMVSSQTMLVQYKETIINLYVQLYDANTADEIFSFALSAHEIVKKANISKNSVSEIIDEIEQNESPINHYLIKKEIQINALFEFIRNYSGYLMLLAALRMRDIFYDKYSTFQIKNEENTLKDLLTILKYIIYLAHFIEYYVYADIINPEVKVIEDDAANIKTNMELLPEIIDNLYDDYIRSQQFSDVNTTDLKVTLNIIVILANKLKESIINYDKILYIYNIGINILTLVELLVQLVSQLQPSELPLSELQSEIVELPQPQFLIKEVELIQDVNTINTLQTFIETNGLVFHSEKSVNIYVDQPDIPFRFMSYFSDKHNKEISFLKKKSHIYCFGILNELYMIRNSVPLFHFKKDMRSSYLLYIIDDSDHISPYLIQRNLVYHIDVNSREYAKHMILNHYEKIMVEKEENFFTGNHIDLLLDDQQTSTKIYSFHFKTESNTDLICWFIIYKSYIFSFSNNEYDGLLVIEETKYTIQDKSILYGPYSEDDLRSKDINFNRHNAAYIDLSNKEFSSLQIDLPNIINLYGLSYVPPPPPPPRLVDDSASIILIGGDLDENNNTIDKKLIDLEELREPVYEAIILKEIIKISDDELETTENILLAKEPFVPVKEFKLKKKLFFFNATVKKLREKKLVSTRELESFNNIENKIENLNVKDIQVKEKVLEYIRKTKEELENQNINIKDANIIDTTKILVNFTKVADIMKKILIGLTIICIIIYIVVLLISIYNIINLLIKAIVSIIYLFYNTAITNNDTLSYTTKNIIKCTKDNYDDDILNIYNEQLTALSIFNTNLYIIYILLGYVIIYILYFIFTSIGAKYYLLIGTINDIDPNFTLLTIIGIIFISSFVHLLIYKFLFKSICLNKFNEISKYEDNIDDQLKNILSGFDQDSEYNTNFYNILTDTTKRNEIDTIFQNKVLELQDDTKNNLIQFLVIYDIYIYFEEFLYLNEEKKIAINKYFDKLNKGEKPENSFISFLDINERKLIKPYHEDLQFYKQIPTDKYETYKKINDAIGDLFANINKSIIKYSGTFYPFLFTCIYIIIIFIYNFICVYLIFSFISGKKNEELFPSFVYTISDKFMDLSRIIYNLFNK